MPPLGTNPPQKKIMQGLRFFLQGVCPRRSGHCFSLVGTFEFCNNNALYYLKSNHYSLLVYFFVFPIFYWGDIVKNCQKKSGAGAVQVLPVEKVVQISCTMMVWNFKQLNLYNQECSALIREIKKKQILVYLTEKCMFCVTWINDARHYIFFVFNRPFALFIFFWLEN